LLSYFRDTAEGEPGGAEADPLQARLGSAGRVVARIGCGGADVLIAMPALCLRAQGLWLEGDSLAPFVVTPLVNVLRALECAATQLPRVDAQAY
jgi:hypothetical protein